MPVATPADYSEQTSREIDCEIRELIDEQYARARALIKTQEPLLRNAAQVLLEKRRSPARNSKPSQNHDELSILLPRNSIAAWHSK